MYCIYDDKQNNSLLHDNLFIIIIYNYNYKRVLYKWIKFPDSMNTQSI